MNPTFKQVKPTSPIFTLVPKYIPKVNKGQKCITAKRKEAKFIPYEPYKGAIEPIVPPKLPKIVNSQLETSKNNIEIHELATHVSHMRILALSKGLPTEDEEKEKIKYATDIQNLRETNLHLENQLKFHAQVNSELKTLLVAAVGEDLESRVQHLAEDKLQLARALLSSTNHLTSHQEQTEWLSGQCEVWRSKFLASSIMVEELVGWKYALSVRIHELQESLRGLLDDRQKVQKKNLRAYCLLENALQLLSNYSNKCELKFSNIVELSNSIKIQSNRINELVNGDKQQVRSTFDQCVKYLGPTVTEKSALKLLKNPVTITDKQDIICNALIGSAISLSENQRYMPNPSMQASCCRHCTGKMENI